MKNIVLLCGVYLCAAYNVSAAECAVSQEKKEQIFTYLCEATPLSAVDAKSLNCPTNKHHYSWAETMFMGVAASEVCGFNERANIARKFLSEEAIIFDTLAMCLPQKISYRTSMPQQINKIKHEFKKYTCDSIVNGMKVSDMSVLATVNSENFQTNIDSAISKIEKRLDIEITPSGDVIERKE